MVTAQEIHDLFKEYDMLTKSKEDYQNRFDFILNQSSLSEFEKSELKLILNQMFALGICINDCSNKYEKFTNLKEYH